MSDAKTPEEPRSEPQLPALEKEGVIPHTSSCQPPVIGSLTDLTSTPDSPSTDDFGRHWNFLANEQRYLSEYIRFADQKAAFIFAFSLASMGFLHKMGAYKELFSDPITWAKTSLLCAGSSSLLLIAATLSFSVLLPRLRSSKKMGLVFWENVAMHKTPDTYSGALFAASSQTLLSEMAEHCFYLCLICLRKYNVIRVAVWVAPAGALLGLLSILGQ